jgi:hypothetical protein
VIDRIEDYEQAAVEFAGFVARMKSVRVAEGSQPRSVVGKRRDQREVQLLFVENDPAAIDELRAALELAPIDQPNAWMTPGTPTLTLVGPDGDLASFSYLFSGWIRLHMDVSDAPLVHKDLLERWLGERLTSGRFSRV